MSLADVAIPALHAFVSTYDHDAHGNPPNNELVITTYLSLAVDPALVKRCRQIVHREFPSLGTNLLTLRVVMTNLLVSCR